MSIVTLVSGGLDSTLMALLTAEAGVVQHPLFIDYGQRSAEAEWKACRLQMRRFRLPVPMRMNLNGFGRLIPSGLTRRGLRINEDAFLPCRNLMFLVAAAGVASSRNAKAVGIGLLDERQKLFGDQSSAFLRRAESAIDVALGQHIAVIAPFIRFSKTDILRLAEVRGVSKTYSCHAGTAQPCGICVSCMEIARARGKADG